MKALPALDPRNWTEQAQIHLNHCPNNKWFLLPWHRGYLYYFEEIYRELTGNESLARPKGEFHGSSSSPSPSRTANKRRREFTRIASCLA
jgi:tyrosinase